jgi:hypothetical protein
LVLIAFGALLAFAVHVTAAGVNVDALGLVLLTAGCVGSALSLLFWSTFDENAPAGTR